MNRGARVTAWGLVGVALVAGPGCMLFDDYSEPYSAEYTREQPPQVSEYPASTGNTTAPGVYTEADRK